MKNNGCFAAVTFAMTIAGACVGYCLRTDGQLTILVTFTISLVGATAAYFSGYRD